MRSQTVLMLAVVSLTSCGTYDAGDVLPDATQLQAASSKPPSLQSFISLESAFQFMLWRNRIATTPENLKAAMGASRVEETAVDGLVFITVRFQRARRTRMHNGPNYVLQRLQNLMLVGEFFGSSLRFRSENGRVVARQRYHWGAGKDYFTDYPFVDGRFNYVSPEARGAIWR